MSKQVILVGGSFSSWWNNFYNNWFGSTFGYTNEVTLGGSKKKTRRNKIIYKK